MFLPSFGHAFTVGGHFWRMLSLGLGHVLSRFLACSLRFSSCFYSALFSGLGHVVYLFRHYVFGCGQVVVILYMF